MKKNKEALTVLMIFNPLKTSNLSNMKNLATFFARFFSHFYGMS